MSNGASPSFPDNSKLDKLCEYLEQAATEMGANGNWPQEQLEQCAHYDIFRWFVPGQFGGFGYSAVELVSGYIRLASACLTTAFVISQRTAACKRIVASENEELKQDLLPKLADGSMFTTVGISHLTTSHRHVEKPVLQAQRTTGGWLLNGFAPWVTGGAFAEFLVVGAAVDDQQILLAVPGDSPGITFAERFQLLALSASHTGKIVFDGVLVPNQLVMRGPAEAVLQTSAHGPSTGGLETSALAMGLASAAVNYICQQAESRGDLAVKASALENERQELLTNILAIADGGQPISKEQLRAAANSFVLRATQSALLTAKGAGFVADHPVGRWCREALFFLVWSCPPAVSDYNLCELAGLEKIN